MNKIKAYFSRHKVTVMVIPSAEKSIKQWKLNIAVAFFILMGLIVINLALLFNTITSRVVTTALSHENESLEVNLLMTQDKLDLLQNINSNKTEEIKTLKNTLQASNNFLTERLTEMEQAQDYISQLVVMFNEETSSDLKAPISRSFSRTDGESASQSAATLTADEVLLSQVNALITNDEISILIEEQTNSYSDLVQSLEKQLSYLDARPDYYPTSGTFSSPFGYRKDPITGRTSMHNGIDISNRSGTPIYAAGAGVVTYAGYDGNFGRVIIVDHGYGYESVYAHLKSMTYSAGDTVSKGQQVGTMGTSGRVTGSHLHFEIRYNGTPINPLKLIKK